MGVVQGLGHRRHQLRRFCQGRPTFWPDRLARVLPSMNLDTTKQGKSSVLPTS